MLRQPHQPDPSGGQVTRAGHRRPGGPRRRVGPYHRVEHDPGDMHPVELAVMRRAPLEELNRRIHEADSQLLEALGDRRTLWLQLEELLTERCVLREETHFDVGYEHGFAAGRADALRSLTGSTLPAEGAPADAHAIAIRTFADRSRDQAIQTGLPRHLAIAAILEVAWALAGDLHQIDDIDNHDPNDRRKDR